MDFDRLVHEAWPAYEQHAHDGWVLRHAGGVTKRANSVLATSLPADLDGAIRAAEAFYAARGQRCVFSIGPGTPPALDEELERRGYALADPTLLMTGEPVGEAGRPGVRVDDRPWPGWLAAWWAVDGRYGSGLEEAERICAGVPAWYAAYEEDGVVLAVGRGVPQGDTLGIYCMATLPGARRRGLARVVLRALVARAGDGAGSAYLVVTAANAGAQALYRGEGFEVAGRYHYRVR
ncbi:GNAT family N-acetyltransferase [Nonomuraea gerenzanensis]|uniref:GCN5-related N-acetyltransferase n=1 Tax=Nonomuraea gerenzanensis TaxID=93944 RepID=A0A1M4EKK9_9ACTN|nr:GNAT family N-acetyltransferase [Nonomuraea gerenzanensis]UBU10937.1 GNAT family N-acetyltransferase [Nonomuraea gerenzanensis]SBO99381.1 GCN5-related N-acetyltransferase [Nonomuraea gerenzanensis]